MSRIELPDFDDMFAIAERISELTLKKISLSTMIELAQADVVKRATTDTSYFVNGKTPSMDYIKNSWMVTGFNNELVETRIELANVISGLEKAKLEFQIYQDMIDLYRTQAANERASVLS